MSTFRSIHVTACPLHDAARKGNIVEIHKLLSKNPKNINKKNSLGKTPVEIAIENGQNDAFIILMISGADIDLAKAAYKKITGIRDDKIVNNTFSQYTSCDLILEQSKTNNGFIPSFFNGNKSIFSSKEYEENQAFIEELNHPSWKIIYFLEDMLNNHDIPIQCDSKLSKYRKARCIQIIESSIKRDPNKPTTLHKSLKGTILDEISDENYEFSCGPISISFAYKLMGYTKDWPQLISSFPYFMMGVYPHEIVSHLNSRKSQSEPKINHIMSHKFEEIIQVVKKEIDNNRPTIALLVQGSATQHYVNLAGYNEEEKTILILDPTGTLKTYPYDWIEKIMYSGIKTDLGIRYLFGSILTIPYMMLKTKFGYYNIFTFS